MLTKEVTYETFDGETVTDKIYFNLSKADLIELMYSKDPKKGLDEYLKEMMAAERVGDMMEQYRDIILTAYGVRSDDGKRFIKTFDLREEFSQSLAFDALYYELLTKPDEAAAFIVGIMPKDMQGEVQKAL